MIESPNKYSDRKTDKLYIVTLVTKLAKVPKSKVDFSNKKILKIESLVKKKCMNSLQKNPRKNILKKSLRGLLRNTL